MAQCRDDHHNRVRAARVRPGPYNTTIGALRQRAGARARQICGGMAPSLKGSLKGKGGGLVGPGNSPVDVDVVRHDFRAPLFVLGPGAPSNGPRNARACSAVVWKSLELFSRRYVLTLEKSKFRPAHQTSSIAVVNPILYTYLTYALLHRPVLHYCRAPL